MSPRSCLVASNLNKSFLSYITAKNQEICPLPKASDWCLIFHLFWVSLPSTSEAIKPNKFKKKSHFLFGILTLSNHATGLNKIIWKFIDGEIKPILGKALLILITVLCPSCTFCRSAEDLHCDIISDLFRSIPSELYIYPSPFCTVLWPKPSVLTVEAQKTCTAILIWFFCVGHSYLYPSLPLRPSMVDAMAL